MEATHPRQRLVEAVLGRIATMTPEEAAEWVAEHRLLSVARDARLPPAVRHLLERWTRGMAARNLFLVDRFRATVDALEDVPVCPLKGIHLLDTVYREDPQSRPLSDVDVLVPEGRIDQAIARLGALGLREIPVSRRIRSISPARVLAGDGWTLDVHDRLGIKHGWPSTWEQVAPVPATVHGREVCVLDAETTLVHLLSHFVKHRPFSRLVWVEDVLRWAERGIDGERVVRRARALGSLRSVAAGVRALRRALGAAVLEDVGGPLGTAADRIAVWLNERLVWRDLGSSPWRAGPGNPVGRTLTAMLLADRPAHRWKLLRAKSLEIRKR